MKSGMSHHVVSCQVGIKKPEMLALQADTWSSEEQDRGEHMEAETSSGTS